MKLYATFIRKVDELPMSRRAKKTREQLFKQPEPTSDLKYKKYMSLVEESVNGGSFPRVSELSVRLEQDRRREEESRLRLAAREQQISHLRQQSQASRF